MPEPGPPGPPVFGATVDEATRCAHYRSPLDIVAIKFACCLRYYPCFQCHAECETHPASPWPRAEWHRAAVLCGECLTELTILQYRGAAACPACGAGFNPGCADHYPLYFGDR